MRARFAARACPSPDRRRRFAALRSGGDGRGPGLQLRSLPDVPRRTQGPRRGAFDVSNGLWAKKNVDSLMTNKVYYVCFGRSGPKQTLHPLGRQVCSSKFLARNEWSSHGSTEVPLDECDV